MTRLKVISVAVASFLSLFVVSALAGEKDTCAVQVGGGVAEGCPADARNSDPNNNEWMSCQFGVDWASCGACQAGGDCQFCYTDRPGMIDTVRSLASDSKLRFYTDDDGVCSFLNVLHDSRYRPKTR